MRFGSPLHAEARYEYAVEIGDEFVGDGADIGRSSRSGKRANWGSFPGDDVCGKSHEYFIGRRRSRILPAEGPHD